VLTLGVGLWFGATQLSSQPTPKPTNLYAPPKTQAVEDPELNPLRKAAEANPDSLPALRSFADALVNKIRSSEKPQTELLFEAMEVLSKILSINPQEPQALLALADISFNQQVFDKSVGYYERYLKLAPGDHAVRARMASGLTFLGKADEALKELKSILSEDPKNFHALAYTSITYAQMGNKKEATTWGEKAVAAAPTEEAKARFGEFLSSVKGGLQNQTSAPTQAASSPYAAFETYIRTNPIAGPKYVRMEATSSVISLYFKEFPMSAMPDFAKQKFMGGIKAKLAELSLKINQVRFLDAEAGTTLDVLDIQDKKE
jgi:tetratricopeptide (TPR) repeat protein